MQIKNKYHLTYNTNAHPAESWEETFLNLQKFLPVVKSEVSPEASFGISLRLSNRASLELTENRNLLSEFQQWLSENDMYVCRMNGFSYGDFQRQKIKDLVYAPDWTSSDRVEYTLRLFEILELLLPKRISGSVTTCPVSYKHWFDHDASFLDVSLKRSAVNLSHVVLSLWKQEQTSGKYLFLNLEPEPGGILETSDDVVHFFRAYLVPTVVDLFETDCDLDPEEAEAIAFKYVKICYDACHFALTFEEVEQTFRKFHQTGIQIGQIQLGAALEFATNKNNMAPIKDLISLYAESSYLHPVRELTQDGIKIYNDLSQLTESLPEGHLLRILLHVPLFTDSYGALKSTRPNALKVLNYLKHHHVTEHLEMETYAWQLLPPELKTDLSDIIIKELNWLKERLELIHEKNSYN